MCAESHEKTQNRPDTSSLSLRNKAMFSRVFHEESIVRRFLEKLLQVQAERIVFKTGSASRDVNGWMPVRLDLYPAGVEAVLHVELQMLECDEGDSLPRRGRYCSNMLDALRAEEKNDAPEEEENCIIFVCNYEPSRGADCGYAKYTVVQRIEPIMVPDPYGWQLLLLNTRYTRDGRHENLDPEILELLDYLREDGDCTAFCGELVKLAAQAVQRVRVGGSCTGSPN